MKKKNLVDNLIIISMVVLSLCGGFFFGKAYTYGEINTALMTLEVSICQPPDNSWYNQSVKYIRYFNTYNLSEVIELGKIKREWLKCHELMQNG